MRQRVAKTLLMRKEEDEWIDDPEWNIIWAEKQLGRVPYDRYEDVVADVTERRPMRSNCLFRAYDIASS